MPACTHDYWIYRASLWPMARNGRTSEGEIFTKKTGRLHLCQRFTLKHLKDFGFGRAGLEEVIQGEVKIVIRDIVNIDQRLLLTTNWNINICQDCRNHENDYSQLTHMARLKIWSAYLPSTMATTSGWKRSFVEEVFVSHKNPGIWDPCDQCTLDNCRWTTIQL